jgi:hypothetical protein
MGLARTELASRNNLNRRCFRGKSRIGHTLQREKISHQNRGAAFRACPCCKTKPELVDYSRSRRLGFREGSFERKPKINSSTKKLTTIYTAILRVSIEGSPKNFAVDG